MYYEEKVIGGILCCRSEPSGEWRRATTDHSKPVNALLMMTNEQRMEVFRFFCTHCGEANPSCHCRNDE